MSLPQVRYKVIMGTEMLTVTAEQMQRIRQAVDTKAPLVSIGGREYRTYLYKKSWPLEERTHEVNDEPARPGMNPQGLRRIQLCWAAVGVKTGATFSESEQAEIAEIRRGYLARKEARQLDPEREAKAQFNAANFDVLFDSFEDKKQAYEAWKQTRAEADAPATYEAAVAIFGLPEGGVA